MKHRNKHLTEEILRMSNPLGSTGTGYPDTRSEMTLTDRVRISLILSTVGRLQAEQQKQVQDFQRKQHVKRWKHKDLFPTHAADTSTAGARVTSATAASASGSVASSGTNINSQPANIDSGDGSKDSELGVSNGD
ncbi:hypothetical protein RND71_014060 [Anisodus tanguticus]|uniref:Uncharacterized protein n=1 Tax=Anisodus tanguticus TaxID=243964 RepID=A0AAE1SA23_9SOLA|nr:hypothetical protein RND71_014060 [Anisodus tanguticus]